MEKINKYKRILFRADSSSNIGTGHIMRDLVLAKQFDNSEIIFAIRDLEGNINHKILESDYKIEILKSNDIEELNNLIKAFAVDLLVIDHYGIDYDFEKQLKVKNSSLKILVLDDTYEKHYCDILLNHNVYAQEELYKGLVPTGCELRCGSNYTLLREEFIKEKNKLINNKSIKDNMKKVIFIAMGGSDTHNLNPKIIKLIENCRNIAIHIVTTNSNANLEELQSYVKDKTWIYLHINSNQIAKLISKSDLAIITPSVISNEIYYMGIPIIAIKVEENQEYMYRYLKKNHIDVLNKFNASKLKKLLSKKGIK